MEEAHVSIAAFGGTFLMMVALNYFFDQEKDAWFHWNGNAWDVLDATTVPVISHPHFTGTGTRTLRDNARKEIDALFRRTFHLTR